MRRLVALVALVVLAGCPSGDGDAGDAGSSRPSGLPPTSPIELAIVSLEDNATRTPSPEELASIKATLDRYVADAVVAPLVSGGPAPDLAAVFTPAALERLVGPDRATVVEEGLPPAPSVRAEWAAVALDTVAGPDEALAVVAARIDLRLRARGPTVDLDVVRTGNLVLVATEAGWRIDSYWLRATHDSREKRAAAEESAASVAGFRVRPALHLALDAHKRLVGRRPEA